MLQVQKGTTLIMRPSGCQGIRPDEMELGTACKMSQLGLSAHVKLTHPLGPQEAWHV